MSRPIVFLSHSGADSVAAQQLARRLEETGVEVWLDIERIRPGDRWTEQIEKALAGADAFAVYVRDPLLRPWVDFEVRVAITRALADSQFRILPLLDTGVTPESLSPFLRQFQALPVGSGRSGVLALQRLLGTLVQQPSMAISLLSAGQEPFRGLEPFRPEDALVFHGRDRETEEILERLRSTTLLVVIGESGSGKSSLVRAGVLPALRRGRFHDGDTWVTEWRIAVMRPADDPFRELADALLNLDPDLAPAERIRVREECSRRLAQGEDGLYGCIAALVPHACHTLLVVDQFEELFTETEDANLRHRFNNSLLKTVGGQGDRRIHALLTLRADFYSRCWEHPKLPARLATSQYPLGRMGREALQAAIEKPLEIAGARSEAGLVETILGEVGDEPGTLPLLEHALLELWKHRSGEILTHEAYQEMGRLIGALNTYAERVFQDLGEENQPFARAIFARLTQRGEDTGDTRRRAARVEIMALGKDEGPCEAVLDALIESRLLTAGKGSEDEQIFEIAHEALIRGWPRLRGWLKEDHEFLLWRQRLERRLDDWKRSGGTDENTLLLGAALSEAEQWKENRGRELNAAEVDYISRSAARDRQRRRMRLKRLVVAVVSVLALSAAALWQAVLRGRDAKQVRANALVAAAAGTPDPLTAALLLTENKDGPEPRYGAAVARKIASERLPVWVGRLEPGASAGPPVFSRDGSHVLAISSVNTVWIWRSDGHGSPVVLRGHTKSIIRASFNFDGTKVLTASLDGTARIWTADGSGPPLLLPHDGEVYAADFSPDGRHVVTAGNDGAARIWHIGQSGPLRNLSTKRGRVFTATYSSDGSRILTGSEAGAALLWPAEETGEAVSLASKLDMGRAAFTRDNSRVVTLEFGTAVVHRADGVGPDVVLGRREENVSGFELSPDGKLVAVFSDVGIATYRVEDGQLLARMQPESGHLSRGSFDPTGRCLAVPLMNATVKVWCPEGSDTLLKGHEVRAFGASFSPNGKLIATAGADGTMRIWLATGPIDPLVLHNVHPWGIQTALSPDGTRILTQGEGKILIWKTDSQDGPLVLRSPPAFGASFDSKGSRIVTANQDGTARLWSIDGKPLQVLRGDEGGVQSARFSPDGTRVLTVSLGTTEKPDTLRIWKIGSSEPTVLTRDRSLRTAVFSPDGTLVATTHGFQPPKLWRANGKGDPTVLQGHDGAVFGEAAFNSAGSLVATASQDGTARVWKTKDGTPIAVLKHQHFVESVAFSPDNRLVATTSRDGTACIWLVDGSKLAEFIEPGMGPQWAEFSPDSALLVVAGSDGMVRIWRIDKTREPVLLTGHSNSVNYATFSRDGTRILTSSIDGTARLWRVTFSALVEHLRSVTQECLTPEQRMRHLGESDDEARKAFESCERHYGRLR